MKKKVTLVCTECLSRNYQINKSASASSQTRLVLNKYCPKCMKHTEHKETK
jgi:large subunit ribosomal protein L33